MFIGVFLKYLIFDNNRLITKEVQTVEKYISMTIKELDHLKVVATLNRGGTNQTEVFEILGITIMEVLLPKEKRPP